MNSKHIFAKYMGNLEENLKWHENNTETYIIYVEIIMS